MSTLIPAKALDELSVEGLKAVHHMGHAATLAADKGKVEGVQVSPRPAEVADTVQSDPQELGIDEVRDNSSADSSTSSPLFAELETKGSSQISLLTEDEDGQKSSNKYNRGPPLQTSPTEEDTKVTSEICAVNTSTAITEHRSLTKRKSIWNLLRSATAVAGSLTAGDNAVELAAPVTVIKRTSSDESSIALRKRGSFASFPQLSWSKSSRRHTITATDIAKIAQSMPIDALCAERSLDESIHLAKVSDVLEVKVAEDAVRFADARHIIKTTQDTYVIRDLAERLEEAWREKQHELTEMRAKNSNLRLHLHDIQDENKQLRSQLAGLSEQIVVRDTDYEALLTITVEQSKKERAIWEEEKRQAVDAVRSQVAEMQRKLTDQQRLFRALHVEDESDEGNEDTVDEEHEATLYSAVSSADVSFDGVLQRHQDGEESLLSTPTGKEEEGRKKSLPTLTDRLAKMESEQYNEGVV